MKDIEQRPRRTGTSVPLVRSFVQHIQARPELVFPLICPTREGEWLEGWAERCELIWSVSGFAEVGCVFRTTEEGRPDTAWIITEHDPDRGVVTFARFTADLVVSTLRIEVGPHGDDGSTVLIRYVAIPINPQGAAYAAQRYDRVDLQASVVWWERSMNHFLKTGQLLRRIESGGHQMARTAGPGRRDKE